MGILRNGLFGQYTGKIGGTVAYLLGDKNVVRVIGKNEHPPSPAQLANRSKMLVVIEFLKPLTDLVKIGFKVMAGKAGIYPHNVAVSYNKRNALMGAYPDIEMDYSKVLIAQGALPAAADATVTLLAEGLYFNWDNSVDMNWPERTDRSILVAYFPGLRKAVYHIAGAKRYAGHDFLPLDMEFRAAYMEIYMAFIAIENDLVSDSVYLGRLN